MVVVVLKKTKAVSRKNIMDLSQIDLKRALSEAVCTKTERQCPESEERELLVMDLPRNELNDMSYV